MDFNSFFFRQPKPTYTAVSISLLPSSELIWVSKAYESSEVVSCNCSLTEKSISVRKIPVLLSKAEPPSQKYLVYFHAMAEDIKDAYDFIFPLKTKFGVNIVLVEYPGYGIYTNHNPSAEFITEDAEAVMDYLLMKRRISREDIVIVGRSMGTGPACHVAARYMPRGLCLISPYTSLRRVAEHFVGSVLAKIVSERFPNIEVIAKVMTPLLVIHGLRDEMIPKEHSQQLLAAAKSRIKLFHFSKEMTHDKFDYENDFQNQMETLLRKIDFIIDPIVQIKPLKVLSLGKILSQSSLPHGRSQSKSKVPSLKLLLQQSVDDEQPSLSPINFYKRRGKDHLTITPIC